VSGGALTGKRALVTGSTAGIGTAIAQRLAADGAFVLVHGRREEAASRVAAEIRAGGGAAEYVIGDLMTDAGAAAVVEAARNVDILVNNSGVYANRTWADATPEDWLTLYNTNVVAMVRLVRPLVGGMRERKWGRLIQLSSGEAQVPFAFMPDYAATKAAIVNLSVSLAKELAGTGITSNTVSPGIIVTEGVERFYRGMARERGWGDDWHTIEGRVLSEVWPCPAGRLGRVEDVAHVVAFLAHPAAGFCNGANYRVDGGAAGCIN
jgi:NAD(P)-dependent dehydrogenase (short-subunit alcohol dehydrogenase family)